MESEEKPVGKVTFAEPTDWVLTVLDEQGTGLPVPQFLIVIVKVVGEPAAAVVGPIAAE